ncbi:MAG: hypothetical protein A2017_07215 [Lentisphaerae bacterium GWF2_44_16]|nr:MAG: hypothetical protein A2017_07215 [Lentisphaerae bacterium GWF2_44_16]
MITDRSYSKSKLKKQEGTNSIMKMNGTETRAGGLKNLQDSNFTPPSLYTGIISFFISAVMLQCTIFSADKISETASVKNTVHLLLPPAVYAVSGVETNIYFDNIILAPNSWNYLFDVDCSHGRQDRERWRYFPEDKDVGKFPLSIKVFDAENHLLAQASTTVYVSQKDAGQGKKISLLLIGDSLTDASIYPEELYRMFKEKGNPEVKFIGTYSGSGKPSEEGKPSHEGYSGWTWAKFCTRWVENPSACIYKMGNSPFVFMKSAKQELDFKAYCDKNNNGKAPDYIIVFLGTNDCFNAKDMNIDATIDNIFKYADLLIGEFRKVGPNTKIAVTLIPPPVATQDGFGQSYNCGQTRWQYRKNQHRLLERMIEKFKGREKGEIFIVPVYLNIDCINNYPKKEEQINARNPKRIIRDANCVHPAKEGYYQIADSFYSWLKYELNQKGI